MYYRMDEGDVRMISKKGKKAVLQISKQETWGKVSKRFNIELLTDTTMFFTRQEHDYYWLPDSVVLKRVKQADEVEL